LLLQGLKDDTVNPNNTRTLQAALVAIGGQVQAKYYDNASHGDLVASFSSLARHRLPVLQEIRNFVVGGVHDAAPSSAGVGDDASLATP
jgi:dipeptidyl aminopeptidase/acylaminoacyl peptidase